MDHIVLVVDDHAPTCDLIRIALEDRGIAVRCAGNGAECLLAVDRERPDLIILDIAMPIMDGLQTLHALRECPDTVDIPIVMLTARSSDDDILRAWQDAITSYVTKPFALQHLVLLVERVLAGEEELQAERSGEPEMDHAAPK